MRSFTRSPLAAHLALALALAALAPAAIAEPHKAIQADAEQYKDDALKLLERLVNIDSGSGYVPGLTKVSDIAIEELKKLGATIELVPNTPEASNHVIATLKGTGKAKILLMAHMDTVFKEGSAAERPFHIKDGRAYGPGVMDDKGGIVAAIYALKVLHNLKFTDYAQITVLLDASEETGSGVATELIKKTAKEHDVTLNLEPGRPADGLVVWRKGSATALVEVKGKASHAGVAPELGRNAATEVAHQILQLGKLGDEEKKTTINFTVLKAGDRTNVIPDQASAKADVRAAVPEEFDRVEQDLARVSATKLVPDTEVKTSLVRGLPPMPQTAQSDALVAMAQGIYGELGRTLTIEGSGGAADSSLSASVGTPTLDGFGIVGGNIHTPEEYAEVGSVAPRIYLLSRMIMKLSGQQ
ncbi:M20/M25/M40 family metallo-hydrolase [Pseudomonas syringae]|uniref:M20/M25/M40 family metallo-hydrolase n=1 Tax=Pseudomonas syringae pv. papulans TaxID=83963 RepID=A0AA43IV41_PSESX|nr:M20/M25/M40 family metallo-hydrolase [Pseudomonas syringae]ALD96754.1 glutamate carboxypeptidase [Pseudomonas syringae UMAF0158]KTB95439.1 glutamate carboxypeptidase [Pseudomonas syringae ICMP 11293]KWS31490.1 glutamate carboxypeptidase [Pseudomonas syringae pv. papulans]MCK9734112.1 M20/M25/M40 family metallo-hydrolase [Pseudomonas syringae pv. syringae]MDH4604559.1 M20/M25/M40 family metallo-hydrolase [Pseudomonas syringae pv. papulans]